MAYKYGNYAHRHNTCVREGLSSTKIDEKALGHQEQQLLGPHYVAGRALSVIHLH